MSDAYVVGSAAFELRATKSKIAQDLEDASREIKAAAKRTDPKGCLTWQTHPAIWPTI